MCVCSENYDSLLCTNILKLLKPKAVELWFINYKQKVHYGLKLVQLNNITTQFLHHSHAFNLHFNATPVTISHMIFIAKSRRGSMISLRYPFTVPDLPGPTSALVH